MHVKGEDSIMRGLEKMLVIGMLPITLFAAPVVYLDDNFNDNDRSNENLPSSGAWYRSFNNLSMVEVSTGDYALKNAPTSATVRHAATYFAPVATPVTLAAGETLTLSLDVTPTSKTPDDAFNVFRFALLDSGSARVSGDNNNPKLTLNGGYGFFSNTQDSRTILWTRSNSNEAYLLSSTTGWGSSFGDQTASSGLAMVQDTTYTITTEIERLADGNVSIDYTVSDGTDSYTLSYLDDTHQYYSFDTFAVAWGGAFGEGNIDNVSITVIPEPAAIGLLGAGAAAMLLIRRKFAM